MSDINQCKNGWLENYVFTSVFVYSVLGVMVFLIIL